MRRGLFQPGTLWWLACGLLAIVFLPYIPWLIPDLTDQPDYRIGWDRVDVTAPPAGVPGNLVEAVRTAAELPEELPLLERGLVERLARAFAAQPWVAEVERVEIRRQRRIDIRLRYRRPAVLIESSRGYYPVDVEGVLLPPRDFTQDAVQRLPIVRNIKSPPQGDPGESWGDVVVTCSARLADALAPEGDLERHWRRLGLAAIVAPAPRTADVRPEDLSFEIQTRGGSVIVWGRVPGADALEPSAEDKLARLGQVVDSQGSLDPPGGPFRIDIRHDVISLQALRERRYR
ncbi:MAG: hypothetical protein KF774_20245 [Planctomyces sp.]|nr:hypothetical protein [Planctomyces sp.]